MQLCFLSYLDELVIADILTLALNSVLGDFANCLFKQVGALLFDFR